MSSGRKITEEEATRRDTAVNMIRLEPFKGCTVPHKYLCTYCKKDYYVRPCDTWEGTSLGHKSCSIPHRLKYNNKVTVEEADRRDALVGMTRLESFKGTQWKHLYKCSFCDEPYLAKPCMIWSGRLKGHHSCSQAHRKKVIRKINKKRFFISKFWMEIKTGARVRDILFEITPEEAKELFLSQNGKCYYSGVDLVLPTVDSYIKTASLDRLDSNKHYYKENCVWCHKDINKMKNKLTEERFLYLCQKIALQNKLEVIEQTVN